MFSERGEKGVIRGVVRGVVSGFQGEIQDSYLRKLA